MDDEVGKTKIAPKSSSWPLVALALATWFGFVVYWLMGQLLADHYEGG